MEENRLWFEAEAERQLLYDLVREGDLSAAAAARRLGIAEEQLRKDMQAELS